MNHRDMLMQLRMEEFRLAAERERLLRAASSKRRRIRAARRSRRGGRVLRIMPLGRDLRGESMSGVFKPQ